MDGTNFKFIICPDCGAQAAVYTGTIKKKEVLVIAHSGQSAVMADGSTLEDCVAWLHVIHRLDVAKPRNFSPSVINKRKI